MSTSTGSFNVIACESMARAVFHFASLTPHRINIILQKIGLHDRPTSLREQLQKKIDQTDQNEFNAILLVYGLCGRAMDGLQSKELPLILPRAHDCITLHLGSREAYNQQQEQQPGTYWYSQDYLERSGRFGDNMALGSMLPAGLNDSYEALREKYGEDNAAYLFQTLNNWQRYYQRAVFFDSELHMDDEIQKKARENSARHGWKFEIIHADFGLIKKLIFGEWDQDLLQVPPYHQLYMTGDERIIDARPLTSPAA
jgi:hypothetical protein